MDTQSTQTIKLPILQPVIMEYLVKISKKARILKLKRRQLKITVLTSYTPYPSRKIRRICACTSQETTKMQSPIRRIQEPLYAVSKGNPQQDLKHKGVIDSGCSRHMTGNKSYLTNYEEIDGGFVAFEDFKLTDESHVLLKVPRKDNMYSVDLKNVIPQGGLTCLFAKATPDESNLWHRRLGHVNFKTMNKLVKGNLVRGLPSKLFEINQTVFACQKGKQHKASCRKHALSFMRPFGCPVTILNTIEHQENGPNCLFDIDALTNSMNYKPVVSGNQSNGNACTKACDDAEEDGKKDDANPRIDSKCINQEKDDDVNSTNNVNAASTNKVNIVEDEDVGVEVDINNLDTFIHVSPIPTTKIHKDHPVEQIIGDLNSAPQTRRMTKNLKEHGYTQEEGIDCDEVFAYVARIEAIRLFLAYASFKYFVVYQMDVKSAFLYGKIEEVVYVCQPPGFKDPNFLDRVYKVEKALYGLHQAPKAWDKGDILLVQVYVDDIIFGSTKKSLCTEFEKMMYKKFQMSSMGKLTFFLGLQVKQKEDGIFIRQDKYVTKILKKFGFTDVKTTNAHMETQKPLLKDEDGEEVYVHLYRSMIGSLMYFTSLRPNIMFAVCVCARYQVNPKMSHLYAVKRIFRYLKGQPKLGLWYPKDSPFDLVAYTNSDYARASLDRKSTTGDYWNGKAAKDEIQVSVVGLTYYWHKLTTACLQALVDRKKVVITESTIRRDLQLEDAEGMDCFPTATIFEELTRMGVEKGFSRAVTPLFPTMMVQAHEEVGEEPIADEGPNEESVPTHSNDPLLSGEDSIKLNELMELCTKLQQRVLDLEHTKTTQALEIDSLKRRVKKLEKKQRSRTHKLKRLYKVGLSDKVISSNDKGLGDQEDASKQGRKIDDIDVDAEITLVFVAEQEVPAQDENLTDDVVTLAQALVALKSAKPKEKGEVVRELVVSVSAATTKVKDKGKGIMISVSDATTKVSTAATTTTVTRPKAKGLVIQEQEQASIPTPIMKKKDQISYDQQEAMRLQAENDIQAKIEADQLLAERLQAREQKELTIEERVKMFQQLLEKRRKFFAAKRAEEKRNRPPTKAQQRSIMCTYLKNMAGWKAKYLKNKSFATIQGLFDKAMKKVNTFVDMDTELVEGSKKRAEDSTKRAGTKLEQEVAKKQKIDDAKVDDDQEEARMKELMNIGPDEEEVAIDAISLATKPLCIVD
ncbi:putative ribonuclease H-like domain-containing protein [Tanacetum coccineum]|uniref:Ribonuclease H-like domain-containing protein n=1 Tax=Tanacetum coccineum TaxID=301880 RepID=A0ABQ5HQH1_9ASTR